MQPAQPTPLAELVKSLAGLEFTLNEFTLLKWPQQVRDLNPIEHLWDGVEWEIHIMDVQPTNLQQLHDAVMSIWTKISEECFQHLVESMPRRMKAVLNAKVGPTRY